MSIIVSRTDLARKTREIVEEVRRGQPVIVTAYGREQAVLLDALDYRILLAAAHFATHTVGEVDEAQQPTSRVIAAYLSDAISLAKAAEELGISRFDLMERFERLGIALRLGPASLQEAQAEVEAARRLSQS